MYLKQMATVALLTVASADAALKMDVLHNISKKKLSKRETLPIHFLKLVLPWY